MIFTGNDLKRRAVRLVKAAAGALIAALALASRADGVVAQTMFTAAEIQRILPHGPWPAPATHDATNRVSGKREAIEFGTKLFFDQRLSGSGNLSCGNCHVPERNWTDNQRRGVGVAELDRNTPTLVNLTGAQWYGWDGAADSLWLQSLRPMLDPRELGATPRQVAQVVRNDADLSCRYRKAFGKAPSPSDDEALFVDIGKALAAFQETLGTGRTPFDHFRDALARGAPSSTWNYSEAAKRGLKLFIGKAGCSNCHTGPNFTSGEFFNTGLSRYAPRGKADPGRLEGVRQLQQSPFNLLGAYNDDNSGASATRVRDSLAGKHTQGEFKVPTLRNLLLTSPFGRDGSIDTLAEVVRHYASIDPLGVHAKDGRPAQPLNLSAREQSDLVVFLESLSTFSNPWRPEDGGRCD